MSDSPRGILVPPWFVPETPSINDQNLASLLWGCSLGIGAWAASEAIIQSSKSWRRTGRINAYVAFIWAEWWSCLLISLICWLYMRGYIAPSFEYFFFVTVLWSIQVQCLLQIIINRVALLMQVPAYATRLKWAIFFIVLALIIAAFCIYIPTRLQISGAYIHAYNIWVRIKVGILLAIDAGLNLCFIYLVRSRLIAAGLDKYRKLYRFNLCMVLFSLSLDFLTIGLIYLSNLFVYAQFHPVVYLIKLHIEMRMADLIGKIVKTSNPINWHGEPPSGKPAHNHISAPASEAETGTTGKKHGWLAALPWHQRLGTNHRDLDFVANPVNLAMAIQAFKRKRLIVL
ncbi:hypothetical protein ACJ41O_003608 [Fusarium nematophilum]